MSTFAAYRSWLVAEAATGFGAATLAGKLLADLGCTVARLEAEEEGAADATDVDRELFELLARAKHSVRIGFDRRGARAALEALLAHAEILLVDRDGLARVRAALGAEDLGARFPRLTVCACTPFGLTGPMAGWIGGEEIVQAVSGIMSITGHAGGGATRIAGAPLTHAAAMFAVSSSLADVLRKRAGGAPGMLDVSVYDAAVAFESASLPAYFLTGAAPAGIGNRHSMSAPWNSFRCADGWVIVCGGNHPNWVRLCEAIGRPELVGDPRYLTQEDRIAHVDALEAEITAWTAPRSVAVVEAAFNAAAIAAGSVMPLPDVLAHPQFRERNLLDAASGCTQIGGVFHLAKEPLAVREGAWRAGAGTRAILVDHCGVAPADYEAWREAGAVAGDREAGRAGAA